MRRVLRGFLLFLQCRPVQFAIPLIAVLALFPCCGGSPFGPGGDDTPRVTITGTIGVGPSVRRAGHGSSAQLDLSDACRVLVFSFSDYQLADIVDGSFSVRAENGTATALIFLGAGDQYIGNLFAGGLNVLPLSNLRDEENVVIDLANLTQDSTSVIPSHDPIGDEIDITPEEVARLRELGAFFDALAQNIDADGDGVPDLLQGRRLTLTSSFSVYGGQWGRGDVPPVVVAIPTLHTDLNGEITTVSLEYRSPDGTPVDPATFITCLQLQLSRFDDTRVEIGSLYERVKTNRTIEQLTSVPVGESIQVSSLRSLSVNYNDVLGNEYSIIWH